MDSTSDNPEPVVDDPKQLLEESLSDNPSGSAPKKKRRRPMLPIRVLYYICFMFISIAVMAMIFEKSFIFFPSKYPDGYWNQPGLDPVDVGFEADDGTKLHGWYVAAEKPTAVILYCHGNAGNITHRGDILRTLRDRVGASVFIFDYRGYGRSEGRPNEPGILKDARAARSKLAELAACEESDIVLMGRSLGGGVAVDLAASDGARGLVLESTFSNLPDVAAHHYPFLPVRILMRTRMDSIAKIEKYKGPYLQSHGNADRIVPFEYGQKLFEASGRPDSDFYVIEGGDHNDSQPSQYYERLREFILAIE